jgi:hypothetical protein
MSITRENQRKWSTFVRRCTDVVVRPGPRKFKERNQIDVRMGFKGIDRYLGHQDGDTQKQQGKEDTR